MLNLLVSDYCFINISSAFECNYDIILPSSHVLV